MIKLNKKQLSSVESLVWNLDELSNKPRRLFKSLYDLTNAFFVKDDEHKLEILADLEEWQEMYYKNINSSYLIEQIARKSRDIRKELLGKDTLKNNCKDNDEFIDGYSKGVKDTVEKLRKEIIIELLEEIY